MKKIWYGIFFLGIIANQGLNGFGKKTIFGIRSQGLSGVRELCGWQQSLFKYDQNRNFGTVALAVEYDHSFRSDHIADFLFGGTSARFSGSMSPNRQKGDILADYFGLPIDFSSRVCIDPRISNVIVDFNWFHDFDAYMPGLFIMIHAPIVHTKWDLHIEENTIMSGLSTSFYPAGYMGSERVSSSVLPHSVTQALQGTTMFGDMQQPLQYGKVMGRQERSRIAELQATIGWNYNRPWWHAGVNFRVGAPTGNTPKAEFLFEEIIGNRHHWDIGIGLSGHVQCWNNEESGSVIAAYIDAHIGHLCTSEQKRSFDLKNNGTGSRYILLEQLGTPTGNLFINGTQPSMQYERMLVPAINATTFDTKISIAVQADIVIKLAYQRDGFECDIGYNFWANSKEKLHSRCALPAHRFALKGDAQIYGFNSATAIPLNATQHTATITGGQEQGNSNFQNLNADNQSALASLAPSNTSLLQLNRVDAQALGIAQVQVRGSNPAILLQDSDIDELSGLLPRALSNKFFVYVGNTWDNRDDYDPYVGIGASVEAADTNPCTNAACSQWAVWGKVGFTY